MRRCQCGCGATVLGRQKYASGACQVRAWRAKQPRAEGPKARAPEPPPKPTVSARCKSCAGLLVGRATPFICDHCRGVREPTHAPLLRVVPRPPDDPVRPVMLYYGSMNIYSRYAEDPAQVHAVCGDAEVAAALAVLTELFGGIVVSTGPVWEVRIPTARLLREAGEGKPGERVIPEEAA